MRNYQEFKEKVEALGLTPKDCGNGHWQIRHKRVKAIINWWPTSGRRTLHVTFPNRTMINTGWKQVYRLCIEIFGREMRPETLPKPGSCDWTTNEESSFPLETGGYTGEQITQAMIEAGIWSESRIKS